MLLYIILGNPFVPSKHLNEHTNITCPKSKIGNEWFPTCCKENTPHELKNLKLVMFILPCKNK